MHRAVCRAIRGACRKVRENDCPALSTEEVRQQNKSQDDFVPPTKHSWTEALGWTTGIVLTYEFIHRRRGLLLDDNTSPLVTASQGLNNRHYCPFRLTTRAIAQPILSTANSVFAVNHREHHRSVGTKIGSPSRSNSIDVTPFINDGEPLLFTDETEFSGDRRNISFLKEEELDDGIQFDENASKIQLARRSGPKDFSVATTAEQISGDIFGVVGAFKFLTGSNSGSGDDVAFKMDASDNSADSESEFPPLSATELMEKGGELGSRRSLYNLGVSYDRLNEPKTAMEYYKRAADLGHPLASYNLAVLRLKDGKIREGLECLQFAAENGVVEARAVIKGFK